VKEDFIHFVWKHKLFNSSQLETTNQEKLHLLNSGIHNHNTGPDFFNAQIMIEGQRWAGNVEIHVNASDWYVHGHENDSNYDSIILHVVWENDVEIYSKENVRIPTLELKNFVNKSTYNNYLKLFRKPRKWINCENDINSVDRFVIDNWLERLFIDRLEKKSTLIQKMLDDSRNDWEAVLIKLLFKNFGLKVNSEAFLNLINSIDISIIKKERKNLKSIEALLFGQAGLLNKDIQDGYGQELLEEFKYLSKKHNLLLNFNSQIQFFRLRPNNFPTIRLAQLAALLYQNQNLFSKIMATTELNDFYDLFDVSISEYWKEHYSFTSRSKRSQKKLSKNFVDLLVINTIAPLKFIYYNVIGKSGEDQVISIIQQIKPEKNAIINNFEKLSITCNNALESQALLQLKNEYCDKKKCLHCSIGNNLLRR